MLEEKRNHPRQAQNQRIHVEILKSTSELITTPVRYEGGMKDISHNGIRLHGKHWLENEALLELKVAFEGDETSYHLSGCVRWVTETTENEFVAGLELNDDENSDIKKWHKKFP